MKNKKEPSKSTRTHLVFAKKPTTVYPYSSDVEDNVIIDVLLEQTFEDDSELTTKKRGI